MKQIKRFFLLLGILLPNFALAQRNAVLSGEILNAEQQISVTVFQKSIFGKWKETTESVNQVYLVKINSKRDTQVWFKSADITKILLIPAQTVDKQLTLNIDFDSEYSAQVNKSEKGYEIQPLDFDFVVLEKPLEIKEYAQIKN